MIKIKCDWCKKEFETTDDLAKLDGSPQKELHWIRPDKTEYTTNHFRVPCDKCRKKL